MGTTEKICGAIAKGTEWGFTRVKDEVCFARGFTTLDNRIEGLNIRFRWHSGILPRPKDGSMRLGAVFSNNVSSLFGDSL